MSLTSILSPRTVNEARVMIGTLSTYWTVDGYADPNGVSISRPSINQGKANNMPQGWDSVRYQFIDTLSHTIGRHELKAGVDIQLDDQNTYLPRQQGRHVHVPHRRAVRSERSLDLSVPVHADDRRLGTTRARTRSIRASSRTRGG